MKKQNKIYIEWERFDIMMDALAEQIRKSGYKFDGIYAIPRGGLIIGVVLSHKLNLPLLRWPNKGRTLVVDEISDTGDTLSEFKSYEIATLFTTNWTRIKPNFWIDYKKKKSDWIVFPWEIK